MRFRTTSGLGRVLINQAEIRGQTILFLLLTSCPSAHETGSSAEKKQRKMHSVRDTVVYFVWQQHFIRKHTFIHWIFQFVAVAALSLQCFLSCKHGSVSLGRHTCPRTQGSKRWRSSLNNHPNQPEKRFQRHSKFYRFNASYTEWVKTNTLKMPLSQEFLSSLAALARVFVAVSFPTHSYPLCVDYHGCVCVCVCLLPSAFD